MTEPVKQRMKITCPGCQTHLDVTDLAPFEEFSCPQCAMTVKVPKRWHEYVFEDCLANHEGIEVYRALDTSLDREVLVELVTSAGGYSAESMEKYLDVIRRSASIADPALETVYGCGRYEDGVYSVTQYMPEALKTSKVQTWEEVHGWLVPVLRVLERLASESLVHGRIGVSALRGSENGNIRVIGFGIGMALENRMRSDSYASPERLAGGEATVAGDIYSLGKVLWRCLSGKLPEEGGVLGDSVPRDVVKLLKDMTMMAPMGRPKSYAEILRRLEAIEESASSKGNKLSNGGTVHGMKRPNVVLPMQPVRTSSNGGLIFALIMLALVIVGLVVWIVVSQNQKPSVRRSAPAGGVAVAGTSEVAGSASAKEVADGKDAVEEESEEDVVEEGKGVGGDRNLDHAGADLKKQSWKPLPEAYRRYRPRLTSPLMRNSRKVKEFIESLPAEYRHGVELQVTYMQNAETLLKEYTSRIKYDRGANTVLRLRRGKVKLRAIVVMANEKGMMLRPLDDATAKKMPAQVQVKDLHRKTFIDMLDYYGEYNLDRFKQIDKTKPEYKLAHKALVRHYMVLTLMCDWYDETELVKKYGKQCIELKPETRDALAKFGIKL